MSEIYNLRIHDITHDDMKNGTGLRVVLWVAGCEHHCPGCHNPITWDADGGINFTPWEESEVFELLSKPWTEGITFSGGDPLHPHNRNGIGELAAKIKKLFPEKNIWLYTGYKLYYNVLHNEFHFQNVNQEGTGFTIPWLDLIDVIVDGRFEQETRMKDIKEHKKVHWRGSSNQRVIDVQESLKTNSIAIMEV